MEKRDSYPYKSGYCNIGAHENADKRSPSGKSLGRCVLPLCNCECHTEVRKMLNFIAEMSPESRSGQPASAFALSGQSDPVKLEPPAMPLERARLVPPLLPKPKLPPPPSPPPSPPPPLPLPVALRYDTGRRVKGQLDALIRQACQQWAAGQLPGDAQGLCTPQYLSELLDASTGAIHAAWTRWEKKGLCEIAKKPVRFLRFLEG